MALPGDVTTTTLTFGPYTDAKGLAALVAAGGKLFAVDPSSNRRIRLTHRASGQVIVPEPVAITIASDGTGSLAGIPHTGQATISPAGYAWRVEWALQTGDKHPSPGNLTFVVPSGATADFDLLVPAATVPAVAISQPTVASVAGLTGAPTAQQVVDALATPLGAAYVRDTELDAQSAALVTAGTGALPVALRTASDARYAPIRAQLRGNLMVCLGDSIMIAQANDSPAVSYGQSMVSHAHWLSKGRLLRVRNAGVAGNRAADMLARFDTDVTPYAPSIVPIMAGTNDWNDATPTTLSSYQATMKALVAKCRGIGAQPVLYTVPPNVISTARRGRTLIGNAWLRRYCAAEGITLIDAYNLLVDPATGDYLAAYGSVSNDKTHPINAGYSALGALTWNTLSSTGDVPLVDPMMPRENGDPNNLLPNGLFLTTTGSGATLMPTGHSVQTSQHPAGVTGSLVTGDPAIKGNWWKVTADGTASATDNQFVTISGNRADTGTPAIVPGHVYAHVGRFKATGMRNADTGSGSSVLVGAAFNSVLLNSAYDFRCVSTISYDIPDGYFSQEMLAPSDASTLLVRRQLINATAGAGTLQLAQLGVYDLTAMGLI
jgi:lysophospholipase L1-like esterase